MSRLMLIAPTTKASITFDQKQDQNFIKTLIYVRDLPRIRSELLFDVHNMYSFATFL